MNNGFEHAHYTNNLFSSWYSTKVPIATKVFINMLLWRSKLI